jgi:hypothetical protein
VPRGPTVPWSVPSASMNGPDGTARISGRSSSIYSVARWSSCWQTARPPARLTGSGYIRTRQGLLRPVLSRSSGRSKQRLRRVSSSSRQAQLLQRLHTARRVLARGCLRLEHPRELAPDVIRHRGGRENHCQGDQNNRNVDWHSGVLLAHDDGLRDERLEVACRWR